MGNSYRIYPILTSRVRLDKGIFTFLRNYGEKILLPNWAFLILGGKEPVLVDTGCSLKEIMENAIFSTGGEEGLPIEESLRRLGVSIADVKTIILTHLHRDHILNARRFPRAKIIVQEEELGFALNPHPVFARLFCKEGYEGLNFETVRGDTEIIPGVETFLTPGHTAGSQSVSVATEKGKVVITGFCAIDDNFSDKEDIIPGNIMDPLKAYDSMIKIRQIADIIIPLHSQRLMDTKSIP